MRVAHLEDPEGNLIELQEWLALCEQAGAASAQEVQRTGVCLRPNLRRVANLVEYRPS